VDIKRLKFFYLAQIGQGNCIFLSYLFDLNTVLINFVGYRFAGVAHFAQMPRYNRPR